MIDTEREAFPLDLTARVKRHAQLLELVAAQIEAVAAGDSERARDTAELLLALREQGEQDGSRLDDAGDDAPEDEAPEEPRSLAEEICSDLDLALTWLANLERAERQAEETWQELTEGAIRTARKIPVQRIAAAQYPSSGPQAARLDVRF